MGHVNEKIRSYWFPEGKIIDVKCVRHIKVSDSGGHRLTCDDGTMVYVPYKWLCIVIDSDNGWEV